MTGQTSRDFSEKQRCRIMKLVVSAGETLLRNGAEVFRVEQTMVLMAHSYHLQEFHVYVITNAIFASAGTSKLFEVRNVPTHAVHLGRVAAVNDLSRQIASQNLTIECAEVALAQAQQIPYPKVGQKILASGVGAFSFCVLYGGSLVDGLLAFITGLVLGCYLQLCQTREIESLFQRLTGAAIATLICFVVSLLFDSVDMNLAVIGPFMLLTPGVAFTMAIRDFVKSDYLSGAIRLLDAVLIAASIACGVGLIMWFASFFQGGIV